MPTLNLTAADFLAAFQRLLPRGPVWSRDPDATITKVIAALQPTYERSTTQANNLLIDAFPATAVQLLPEWQSALGLPDPGIAASPLLSQQQAQVVARLTGRGKNQSAQFFISFALTLGFPITITQFAPFRASQSAAGDPVCSEAWCFAWQINAPTFTVNHFVAGDTAGSPLASSSGTILPFEIQRLAPAHTIPLFNFST
jgi:uncharacterized protein YmfQ (DUF2313 family)